MMFGGVFTRFPRLRVAFAHGGGGFPFTIGRIDHAFHARPDLVAIDNPVAPRDYLARTDADKSIAARFFVDSLVFDPDAVRLLLKYFGPDRVALGSDYPFPLGEAQPGRMVESMDDLSGEVKAQILGGSARDFLRLADP
jgi:aminocarboxymuconate-semialdehyde decarboxylase